MKVTKNTLRERKVYNEWEMIGRGNVGVVYCAGDYGRGGSSPKVQVWMPGFQTDPKAHWKDNGNKSFHLFNGGKTFAERKQKALDEAFAWADEKFGKKHEWVKTPFGSYMDKSVYESRIKEIFAEPTAPTSDTGGKE